MLFLTAYTRKLSSLDVSSSPSVDSHGIAERQCLCQRSKQAFTFKLVFQELPRLVDLVSWWQQSARVGFLIALHHRGSISWDVTDVPCMLSPSDRQRLYTDSVNAAKSFESQHVQCARALRVLGNIEATNATRTNCQHSMKSSLQCPQCSLARAKNVHSSVWLSVKACSFSSTCRHLQRLCQHSVVPITVAACSSSLCTDSVNTASQFAKSCPGLQLSIWFSFLVADFSSLCNNERCRLMCTYATCYWLNRRVLGNIEATNATRSQIHT